MLGIVGFVRILENVGKKDCINIQNNYIEFDSDLLKDFHKCYFQYFFDKYNVGEKSKEKINNSFEKIKLYLEDVENKKVDLKNEKNNIRKYIKDQIKKIEKFDVESSNELSLNNEILERINSKDDIEKINELKEKIIKILNREMINKKITSNLYKSILSNSYFGQPSFLNVSKNAANYEKLQEIM